MKILKLFTVAILLLSIKVQAATYYISTTGSDSNAGTSSGAAFATFTHALAAMSGCDTLIVENGYYYDHANMNTSNLAGNVSGSGCYTVVEAATPWAVTIDSSHMGTSPSATFFIGEPYIQVIGIKAAANPNDTGAGGSDIPWMVMATNHVKLQQTAGFNAPCAFTGVNWNMDVYAIGPADSYVLVEDSHAWGCGRYKFLAYQSDHVIFRRDVSRHDYAGGTSSTTVEQQVADFTNYDSQYTLFQNDIAIDSGDAAQDTGNLYGGLWSEHHEPATDNDISVEGSIIDNVQADVGLQDAKQTGTHTFINDAIVNSNAGLMIGELVNSTAVTSVTLGSSVATVTTSTSLPVWGTAYGAFSGLTGSAAVLNGQRFTIPSLSTITSITGTAPNMTVNGSFPDWSSSWVGALLSLGGATNAGNDSNGSGGTQFTITGGSTTSISYTNSTGVAETPPGTAWVEVAPVFKVNYLAATPGGPYSTSGSFGWVTGQTPPTVSVSHMTIANIVNTTSNYSDGGNGALGIGMLGGNPFTYYASQTVNNNILQGVNSTGAPRTFAMSDWLYSNYDYYYQNNTNFGQTFYMGYTPTAGANDAVNVNPQIKYITREEPGTPVYGTASDGGNIGATILYEIGTTGTLYGDPGYDTTTGTSLWPFPNEGVIKSDMASFSMTNPVYGGTISGARGFAASGTGLYGGPITLTSYVWEALGNACPSGICAGGSTVNSMISGNVIMSGQTQ
jgi:hypothetical protein